MRKCLIFFFAALMAGPLAAALTTGPFPACRDLDQNLGRNTAGTHLVIDGVDFLLPGPFQAPGAFQFRRSTGGSFVVANATDLVPPNDRIVVFLIPTNSGDLLVEVEDFTTPRGIAFECLFENPAASPLLRLAMVEHSNPTGTDQRVRWVDVADPPGADGFSLHTQQIESVRFAPSGTAAVVKHHLPTGAEWAVIDNCPGATGTLLANFQNLGADVTLALVTTGSGFAVELTPQGGTPVQVAVTDCLGGGPVNRTLNVTVSGAGQGTITDDMGQILCSAGGGSCQGTYADGTMVQLTASPAGGSRFTGWSGDCSGTSSPLQVTMDQNRSCTATFAPAQADLAPFVTATPNPATAGGTVDLELGLDNLGPDPTTFADVSTTLPTGFSFDSAASDPACQAFGTTVRCSLGVIAAGSSASAGVRLAIDPDLRGAQSFTVTRLSLPADPVSANDTAMLALGIDATADLVLSKQVVVDPAAPGDVIAWTVLLTNQGPSTALDPVVTDPLPAFTASFFDPTITTLSCDLFPLPPGESRRLTFFARLFDVAPIGSIITNTADAVSLDADPTPGDAVASDTFTVGNGGPPSSGQRWTRIVQSGETGPLGLPWLTFEPPAVDGETVAFAGRAADGLTTDVRWWVEGTAFSIVESGSGVPGAGGAQPVLFYGVSADAGQVAFTGTGGGFSGTYATAPCGLEVLADDAGNLGGGFEGQIANGVMAQTASGNGFFGVVLNTDPITLIAQHGDQIPGAPAGATFGGFGTTPSWDGTTVLFHGDAGAPGGGSPNFPGIFFWRGGVLDVVADTTTPAPDGGNFIGFNIEVAVDGDLAWFFATTGNGRGLYRADLTTGAITLVANSTVALPDDPSATFATLDVNVAAQGGRAVFVARASTPNGGGIFLADGTGLRRLARDGESLPGGATLLLPRIGLDALDGPYLGVLSGLSTLVPEVIWRLDVDAGPIFSDGFEGGDISRWSRAVGSP